MPTYPHPWRALSPALIRVLSAPVHAYRRWISPALPPRCRFHPSCSAYTLEALHVHGPVRGLGLAVWRILRCQPFHPGGYDPVPLRGSARADRDRPNNLVSGACR